MGPPRNFESIDQEGEVVTLSIYRKGGSCRLSKMFKNGTTYDHSITLPGRTPRSEAVVVFDLHDIIEIPQGLEGGETSKRQRAELEEKAAKFRAENAKGTE